MPITKVTVENFMGIADKVEVPIRPITLLFGANSAGKSTILQALLYLRELLEGTHRHRWNEYRPGTDVFDLADAWKVSSAGVFRILI